MAMAMWRRRVLDGHDLYPRWPARENEQSGRTLQETVARARNMAYTSSRLGGKRRMRAENSGAVIIHCLGYNTDSWRAPQVWAAVGAARDCKPT
jgi:hypothetical protein